MRFRLAHQRDEMTGTFRIGEKRIGPGERAYVIAEIGSNHGDDLETAKRYIETASWAGADAAKFQLYNADTLYPGQHTPGSIPVWWLPHLKRACRDFGVEFLCSVFDTDLLEDYMDVDPVAVKIASPEAADMDLLYCAGHWGRPVLLATGACDMRTVQRAMTVLNGFDVALLHCVSAYPAPAVEMNLRVLPELAAAFRVPVGLSDHTLHGPAPAVACAFGASVIEKHLTFNRTLDGPDHPFALEPREFAQMCSDVRLVGAMLGDGVKRVSVSEDPLDRRQAA